LWAVATCGAACGCWRARRRRLRPRRGAASVRRRLQRVGSRLRGRRSAVARAGAVLLRACVACAACGAVRRVLACAGCRCALGGAKKKKRWAIEVNIITGRVFPTQGGGVGPWLARCEPLLSREVFCVSARLCVLELGGHTLYVAPQRVDAWEKKSPPIFG